MSAACEVKGVAFYTFFEALRDLRGEEAVELTREHLPREVREGLRLGGISRVGYYALSDYASVHAAAHRALNGGEALARQLGRRATEIDTRGVLRFVLGVASTELLMRHADKVWSSYSRGGRVAIQKVENLRYAIEFEGLVGANDLVFAEIEGALEMLAERTGAADVTVRRRAGKDATSARYLVSWRV